MCDCNVLLIIEILLVFFCFFFPGQWQVYRKMGVVLKFNYGAEILFECHRSNYNLDCRDPRWKIGI